MSKENNNNQPNLENVHWADNSAQRVIDTFPDEKEYTVASGITPSGTVHIGNFREVITSELVRRALEDKKKKTKFIYSWDSYDAFRKVPKNVPENWEKYLRLPDGEVPDPWGCHKTYAHHFMEEMEKSIEPLGFPIIFQRQHELQTSGIYAEGIKKALNNREKIREILDKYREEPLTKDWFPLSVYSEKTGKDTTKIISYDEKYTIEYECLETKYKGKINFKENPKVKLAWKLDWPMRWNHYKVDFEPGGKDHSTPGSSYTVGCEIIRSTWNREPPVYTAYDFLRMKGQGGKISSSKGNGVNVADLLKIYTPELLLFLFAGTRPNAEFDISFDLDVIKIYEDFDKLERLYYGLEEEKNPKKLATLKRTYELSMPGNKPKDRAPQKKIPFQPSFRHLTTVAQSNDFEFAKIKAYYKDQIKTKFDEERLKLRVECVKNWLEMYAPEDMKFSINEKVTQKLSKKEIEVVKDVQDILTNSKTSEEFFPQMKEIIAKHEIEMKEFFTLFYGIILSKEKGPKLTDFMIENKEKILNLLKQIK